MAVGLWLLSTTIFPVPETVWLLHRISPWLVEESEMHTLSGVLETRCLSSSCSEGQPGFSCQTLSSWSVYVEWVMLPGWLWKTYGSGAFRGVVGAALTPTGS